MSEQFLHRVFLVLAIIALTLFGSHMIVISYRDLQEIGVFEASSSPRSIPKLSPRRQRFVPTPEDGDLIQGWMTVAYVNRMFRLPPDYLKTELKLINPKYPNIVLDDIAREKKVSEDVFLQEFKRSVTEYLEGTAEQAL